MKVNDILNTVHFILCFVFINSASDPYDLVCYLRYTPNSNFRNSRLSLQQLGETTTNRILRGSNRRDQLCYTHAASVTAA